MPPCAVRRSCLRMHLSTAARRPWLRRLCSIDRDQSGPSTAHARLYRPASSAVAPACSPPLCIDAGRPPTSRGRTSDHYVLPVPCPGCRRPASSAHMYKRRQRSGNRPYRPGDGWVRPRTAAAAAAIAPGR